jgi:hypothetical protein
MCSGDRALERRGSFGLQRCKDCVVAGERVPATRIYYIASEEVVRVIRVLHGKRDIELLL